MKGARVSRGHSRVQLAGPSPGGGSWRRAAVWGGSLAAGNFPQSWQPAPVTKFAPPLTPAWPALLRRVTPALPFATSSGRARPSLQRAPGPARASRSPGSTIRWSPRRRLRTSLCPFPAAAAPAASPETSSFLSLLPPSLSCCSSDLAQTSQRASAAEVLPSTADTPRLLPGLL